MNAGTLFDIYEVRARIAPALIVALPWIFGILALAQALGTMSLMTSGAALGFLALLYVFSFMVRGLGRRIEERLWQSWGGPPSATILSAGDSTFSAETKVRIRVALKEALGIKGAGDPNWNRDVTQVQEAFRLVRQYIRQRDPRGLWLTHNAEYGFLRNLLGSWWLLLINSLLVAGIGAMLYRELGCTLSLVVAGACLGLGLVAIAVRVFVLPAATRTAAARYAESAWTSFITNAGVSEGAKDGGSRA